MQPVTKTSWPRKAGLPRGTIQLSEVSKRFRKHTVRRQSYTTVKSSLLTRMFRKRFPQDNYVHALQTLSLTLNPGSSVGVIGRNGSGKSTLLKLVAGIYRPDHGTVQVSGRISALIELGAGFHPDFTGRENVYLGGVMYGLSRREIDEKFDAIVRYAELEDFIDDPVRTYSSGMYMRLGFSLAVHTDPDILLIDEVLAVGDAGFIHRCHDTISDFRRRGKTMLFVTHDLDSVSRWCDEAIWLEKGKVQRRGDPRAVIASYLGAIDAEEELKLESENVSRADEPRADAPGQTAFEEETERQEPESIEARSKAGRWGNKEAEILDVRMVDGSGQPRWLFHGDEPVTIEVRYRLNEPLSELVCGVGILRADGVCVFGTNTGIDGVVVPLSQGEAGATCRFQFILPRMGLLEDSYFLDIALHREDGTPYDYHHRLHKFSVRTGKRHHGVYNPEHHWSFEQLSAAEAGEGQQGSHSEGRSARTTAMG